MTESNQFVLFPLGAKRFALPADLVAELARPDRLHTFPHTTSLLAGVLVRRGQVIPVCDVAEVLVGKGAPARKFYLIAAPHAARRPEWTALPVTGECELASAQMLQPTGELPQYVAGLLALENEIVDVIDLEKLIATEAHA